MGTTISSVIESNIIFPVPDCSYDGNLKDLIWIDENHPVVGPPNHPSKFNNFKNFFPVIFIKSQVPTQSTILYWHGNSCDLGQIYDELEELSQGINFNVCGIEFPGYGLRSDIYPSSKIINEWSQAIFNFLVWSGIPIPSIFFLGRSIGSGPACTLALKLFQEYRFQKNILLGGLILHSPFKSLQELSQDYAGKLGPMVVTDYWNNSKAVSLLPKDFPILIIHGINDEIIPVYHGISIHELSPSVKKFSTIHQDCPHNAYSVTEHLTKPINQFLMELNYENKYGKVDILSKYDTLLDQELSNNNNEKLDATGIGLRRTLSTKFFLSLFSKFIDSPVQSNIKNDQAIENNLQKEGLKENIAKIVAEAKENALKDYV